MRNVDLKNIATSNANRSRGSEPVLTSCNKERSIQGSSRKSEGGARLGWAGARVGITYAWLPDLPDLPHHVMSQ